MKSSASMVVVMWSAKRPDSVNALDLPDVKTALPRYVDVVRGKRYPKYMIAQSIEAKYSRRDETETLWEKHDALLETYNETEANIKRKPRKTQQSFLDLKILLAHRIMQNCEFCERRCGSDRLHGDKGYCKAGRNFSLFSSFPHMG